MPQEIFCDVDLLEKWYRQSFKDAEKRPGQAAEPRPQSVTLKLLEEVVETCVGMGISSLDIVECVITCLKKEDAAAMLKREIDLQDVEEELADVQILIRILAGLCGVHSIDLECAVERKHDKNLGRRWRVNEFGGLSHIKGAPTSVATDED